MKICWPLLALLLFSCARTPSFHSSLPNAIAVLEEITVNGVQQQLLIRGSDDNNPILLFLHGGPGMPMMYLSHRFQRPLEHKFLVVHWDQRMAGKSFQKEFDPEKISVSQYLDDAVKVIYYLLQRFDQDQLFLVGHSWGSYLGMQLVSEHPALFAAYIGVGQVVDDSLAIGVQREFLMQQATERKDQRAIERISGNTGWFEKYLFDYEAELKHHKGYWPFIWAGLGSKEYSMTDVLNVGRGSSLSSQLMKFDRPRSLITHFRSTGVPLYFFVGRYDQVTPHNLIAEYFDVIESPHKELIWFDDSAHFPFFEEPGKFYEEMVKVKNANSKSTAK